MKFKVDKKLFSSLELYNEEVGQLLLELVKIRSLSGLELEIQEFLRKKFSEIEGIHAELVLFPDDIKKDKSFVIFQQETDSGLRYLEDYRCKSPNLILRFDKPSGKILSFNTHSDTVPNKTQIRKVGRTIYGPGACDAKGQIVALYIALREMSKIGLRNPNIICQVVTQEEKGGNGSLSLIKQDLAGDYCVVLEPNQVPINKQLSYLFHHGGRGALWHKIIINGISTHQGSYYKGISAISVLQHFLAIVQKYTYELIEKEKENLWFDAKRNIQYCDSQVTTEEKHFSKLPDKVQCFFSIGFVQSGSLEKIKMDLKTLLQKAKLAYAEEKISFYNKYFNRDPEKENLINQVIKWRNDPNTAIVTFPELQNDAYLLDEKSPFVDYVRNGFSNLKSETNLPISSHPSAWQASCDAQKLVIKGKVPTVVIGAGELQFAHSNREHIETNQILGLAGIIIHLAMNWNGGL